MVDEKGLEIQFGDLIDIESVRKSVKGVDIIFHLGALISIPYSYENPRAYVNTNILGSLNILQAAKEEGVEKIIHTSTSEVYGTAQYKPIDEDHPLVGQSPYSASKIGADKIAQSFYLSYKTPVIVARPFNTYGPRQSPRAVIPTIIIQALEGDELLLGDITTKRDFNYVEDIVNGLIKISEEGKMGEVYNIGSGRSVSISEVIEEVEKALNKKLLIKRNESKIRPKESEVRVLICNNEKLKGIGWKPYVNLDEGIKKTIEWLKEHRDFYKVGDHFI